MVADSEMDSPTVFRCAKYLLPALLLVATPVHGQAASSSTPEQVVREAFRAVSERRWRDAATLVHPQAVRELLDERVKLARLAERRPQIDTASAPLVGIPACVAEFFNSMGEVASRSGLSRDFANVGSVGALEQLEPTEAMARWIEAHDAGERLRAFRPLTPPGAPMLTAEPALERTVLGTVSEGDSLAHVTYREVHRLNTDLVVEQAVRAVSLRRTDQGWRLLLNEPFFGYRPVPLPIPEVPGQP